jgi:hypothetical protein
MGLQKNITLDNTINLPEAYIKISSLSIFPNNSVTITVNIYKDFAARQAEKPSVVEFRHSCTGADYYTYFAENILLGDGVSIMSQSYMWLKALPFYSTAVNIDTIDKE